MNNQTIDGVPRERIQEIISDIGRGGRLTAVEKLRALLDAPVTEIDPIVGVLERCLSEGVQPTFSGGDLKHLIRLLESKPAAQLQGEPAKLPAKKYPEYWNKGALRSCNMEYMEGYNDAVDDVAKLGPLYAEQPAPVSN